MFTGQFENKTSVYSRYVDFLTSSPKTEVRRPK